MRRRMKKALTLALLGSVACGGAEPSLRPSDLRGVSLPEPLEKVDFTLPSAAGGEFSFRKETDGYLTLLFFGYTNCPDVCPVHMANLASVLRTLPPDIAEQIKVVFVSTDPARDSLPRIRDWLAGFDPDFVGLRGPLDSVNTIQRRFRLAPAVVPMGEHDSDYQVGHAAQIIAFTTDNLAHVVYPFGTRQADWAHDLPLLVRQRWSPGSES